MILRLSKVFALAAFFGSCNAPSDRAPNKFSDPIIVKLADFKDRRLADSLYPFFDHKDPIYRREAVEAFASIQRADNIDRIGKLLMMDADPGVRRAAAFALGQIADRGGERLLLAALVKEKKPENTMTILEAYGKVTDKWDLEPEPFLDDSVESAGLAWSLYRAGLRYATDSVANGIAKRLLAIDFPVTTRLGAAHYFARGSANFPEAADALVKASTTDDSPAVRMAAALALGKIRTDTCLSTLKKIIARENDDRVVINAIRALRAFPFKQIELTLYDCLRNQDVHVSVAASEVIRDLASEDTWIAIAAQASHVEQWRVKANLLEGALKASQHKDLVTEIQAYYRNEPDPYVKAALLSTLQYYTPANDFVRTKVGVADTAILRSTAAATLVGMNRSKSFSARDKKKFAQMYIEIMRTSDDPAVLGTIASALADSSLNYRAIISDASFLNDAKRKLRLPENIEALQPLESAIAYINGKPAPTITNDYNHPIDWHLVKTIPEDLAMTIKTTRGDLVVRLFVNEAPGSVANFVRLAQSDYFDDKIFHRVVPNFVIQGGCKRGDGWGSENYSIRSEFSQHRYGTGTLGMASAGKDTEGTQWFITHSPAPHLDGRYTVFGEVVQGMKVIDYITIGDRVIDVESENFRAQ